MFLLYFYYTIQAKVIIMFAEMVIIVEQYEQKGNVWPKKKQIFSGVAFERSAKYVSFSFLLCLMMGKNNWNKFHVFNLYFIVCSYQI